MYHLFFYDSHISLKLFKIKTMCFVEMYFHSCLKMRNKIYTNIRHCKKIFKLVNNVKSLVRESAVQAQK